MIRPGLHHRLAAICLLALGIAAGARLHAATLDQEEQALVTLINGYRRQHGLRALALSPTLAAAATWMSADMGRYNYMAHTDSLGRGYAQRLVAFGYLYPTDRGENIAGGDETALATFHQWKSSPAHDMTLLDPRYRAVGIARAYAPGSRYAWYWAANFGGYDDSARGRSLSTDCLAPVVAIISPRDGATLTGQATIRANALDETELERVTCQVDDGAPQELPTPPFVFPLNTTLLANGRHTITVTAYDNSGNSAARSVAVTVANAAGAYAVPAPPRNVQVDEQEEGIAISWEAATSGEAPTDYELQTAVYLQNELRYTTYTIAVPSTHFFLAGGTPGPAQVRVRAVNAVGAGDYSPWVSITGEYVP